MDKYYKYDNFWRRFIALFIDGIILGIVEKLLTKIPTTDSIIYSTTLSLVVSCFPYVYSILMVGKYGQTVGKMLLGIKVVDHLTENKATYFQAFSREAIPLLLVLIAIVAGLIVFAGEDLENFKPSTLGYIILFIPPSALFLWSLTEIITMLFNDKNRALHDILADTVVVKTEN